MTTKNERERLAVLETDSKWIKDTLKEMSPKINEMHTTFSKGEGKISELKTEVFGNGNPGLRKEIGDIKIKMAKYAGGVAVLLIVVQIGLAVFL